MTVVDIKALRKRLGLTQAEFATRYNLSLRVIQNWEAGRDQPSSAATVLLSLIEREPEKIAEILGSSVMAQVSYQKIHDVLQELIMAATIVQRDVYDDFPDLRHGIANLVADGEYSRDPFARLHEAIETASAVAREMERLP